MDDKEILDWLYSDLDDLIDMEYNNNCEEEGNNECICGTGGAAQRVGNCIS